MNSLSQRRVTELLSQYLDGALSDSRRKEVEQLLSTDDGVRKEFEQLERMKNLLSDRRTVEPNIGFWTRLSTKIDAGGDEEKLLPFPRKYVPIAAVSGFLGIVLIGVVIFQNRMSLFQFVTEKSQMVQSAYEEGILKGSILPLFAHVTDNQALQFSLSGVLPLDAKAETALRVEQDPTKGYQIKLGKTSPKKSAQFTTKDFYAEIGASQFQRKAIDSLVGLARRRIETSVLLSENNAVAIDPGLAQLNKQMVSNIAACLEPKQRIRFGRFLEKRDAPYTFISKKFAPIDPETLLVNMRRSVRPEKFLVFTGDSMAIARVNAEMIRMAERNAEFAERARERYEQNVDITVKVLKRFADRGEHVVRVPSPDLPRFEVWGDANAVSIQFKQVPDMPRWEMRQPVVVPYPRRVPQPFVVTPKTNVRLTYYGDSITSAEIFMDSAMIRFFNRANPAEYNLRTVDSIFSAMNFRFQMHPNIMNMDSVFRAMEEAQRSFMESARAHPPMKKKEIRVRREE